MLLLKIWGKDHGPWMQALHLVVGVGAIIGPLIANPFLAQDDSYPCESNCTIQFQESHINFVRYEHAN